MIALTPSGGQRRIDLGMMSSPVNLFTSSEGEAAAYCLRNIALLSPDIDSLDQTEVIPIPDTLADDGSGYATGGVLGGTATLCDSRGIYSMNSQGRTSQLADWRESQLPETTVFFVFQLEGEHLFCSTLTSAYILSYTAKEAQSGQLYSIEDLETENSISACVGMEGTIYAASFQKINGDVIESYIFELFPEGESIYVEEAGWGIDEITGNGDSIWMLECSETFSNGGVLYNWRLAQISVQGQLLQLVGLEESTGSRYYGLAVDNEGYVYTVRYGDVNKNSVTVVSPQGEVSSIELGDDTAYFDLKTSSGGKAIFVALRDEPGAEYSTRAIELSPELTDISRAEAIVVPSSVTEPGSGYFLSGVDGSLLVLGERSGLYGIDSAGELKKLLIWEEADLPAVSALGYVYLFDDSTIFCYDGFDAAFLLVPAKGVTEQKETLTLATFIDVNSLNYASCINEFNSLSKEYYIEVINYCEDDRSRQDALTLLGTHMIAGDGPDMICFGASVSPNAYASKGYLMDMYEFLDEDQELGREDIMMLSRMEYQGGLYTIAANFLINSWYSFYPGLDAGDLSYNSFLEIAEALPEGGAMSTVVTPEDFLSQCLEGYIPQAVDWEEGECYFDTEEFKDLLELASRVGETGADVSQMDVDEAAAMIARGDIVLNYAGISSPYDIAQLEREYGREVSFPGWPTPAGEGGNTVYFFERFGITSQCSSPQGAWEFIKSVVTSETATEGIMSAVSAPVLRSALEEDIEYYLDPAAQFQGAQVTQDENGAYYVDGVLYDGLGDPREMEPLVSQEQVDKYYELLDSAYIVSAGELTIREIIMGEAQPYFAGQRSGEETAEIIQSRAGLYIAEQS